MKQFGAWAGTAVMLSAAVFVPAHAEEASSSFCEQVADAAAGANRNLDTSTVQLRNSAPFVRDWLVSSGFVETDDGFQPFGKARPCDTGPEADTSLPCVDVFGNLETYRGAAYDADPERYEQFIRWNLPVGLLPFDGRFLTVLADADYSPYRRGWSTGAFLKAVLDGPEVMCTFNNRVQETYLQDFGLLPEQGTCEAIVTSTDSKLPDRQTFPEADKAALFGAGEARKPATPQLSDLYMGGYLDIDIDGDGTTERLVSITHSPTTGICNYQYYDLLQPGRTDRFDDSPLRALVAEAQGPQYPDGPDGCYRRTQLRVQDGKVLFERGPASDFEIPESGGPRFTRYGGVLQRTVRMIEDGKVVTLCRARFSIEPVIAYDRERAEDAAAD